MIVLHEYLADTLYLIILRFSVFRGLKIHDFGLARPNEDTMRPFDAIKAISEALQQAT